MQSVVLSPVPHSKDGLVVPVAPVGCPGLTTVDQQVIGSWGSQETEHTLPVQEGLDDQRASQNSQEFTGLTTTQNSLSSM